MPKSRWFVMCVDEDERIDGFPDHTRDALVFNINLKHVVIDGLIVTTYRKSEILGSHLSGLEITLWWGMKYRVIKIK